MAENLPPGVVLDPLYTPVTGGHGHGRRRRECTASTRVLQLTLSGRGLSCVVHSEAEHFFYFLKNF